MKSLLMVCSILGSAVSFGATLPQSITCVDTDQASQYQAFIDIQVNPASYNLGYSYPMGTERAQHVTANGGGSFSEDQGVITMIGDSFGTKLTLHPQGLPNRYTGLLTGPVLSPDQRLGRVNNYSLNCLAK